jgi:lysophospholipase L1-like esterase
MIRPWLVLAGPHEMKMKFMTGILALVFAGTASGAGRYLEVHYPPSTKQDELQMGVTYTLWLPDGVTRLRGILVHQHGCGSGACQGGATAAYDLHWQALAKKWDCALLGPSYQQDDKQRCRLWCDPRNGSDKTFLQAIGEFAKKSGHPELEQVPWCLWGHSGGGFWASLMQTLHPQRIVAIWLRSGTAFAAWEKGDIAKPDVPESAYQVPMMCNPGAKEKDDKRFNGAWNDTLAMFKAYRAKGALIGFAPDPRTSHECGDSRYLAIPFFDACLSLRLPDQDSKDQKLKVLDSKQGWLAPLLGETVQPAASYPGAVHEAVWLPTERVAKAWSEYVRTGGVSDHTPPPAPFNVKVLAKAEQGIEISWDAEADVESGLQAFRIQRDGKELTQVPAKPIGKFGRPLFQSMSYHDTPEKPLPQMRFLDHTAPSGEKHLYRVIAVNSVGLSSEPAQATTQAANERTNIHLRGSLSNARFQFEKRRTGHVAFLGGSITEMNGYRPLVCDLLSRRFPQTKFTFTNAGIASTCSTTGAFRLRTDVLAKGPVDLLFVEFAVNDDQDAGHSRRECIRGMEGIIRQTRAHNPNADIVITYFVNPSMLQMIQQGGVPLTIRSHEEVASHYAISTVNLAREVAGRIQAGTLTWEHYGGVHPGRPGNELCATLIEDLLNAAWKEALPTDDRPTPHRLPAQPLDPNHYGAGRFIDLKEATLGRGWKQEQLDWKSLPGMCRERFRSVPLVCAMQPGAELTLDFEGRAIGAYVLAGPDAGIVEAAIDGGPFTPTDLFHRFSKGLHYPRTVLFAADLPTGRHRLTIRITDKRNQESKGTAMRILEFVAN